MQKHAKQLVDVVSVSEAALMFGRHPDTIKYHINRGNLVWRKIGSERRGMYIIQIASLVALYGQPQFSMPSWVQ